MKAILRCDTKNMASTVFNTLKAIAKSAEFIGSPESGADENK